MEKFDECIELALSILITGVCDIFNYPYYKYTTNNLHYIIFEMSFI